MDHGPLSYQYSRWMTIVVLTIAMAAVAVMLMWLCLLQLMANVDDRQGDGCRGGGPLRHD